MTLRAISYGGGVQSTALLVLAATGQVEFPVFLFANTGDNAENPDTLAYVRDVAMPYAKANGIEMHELSRQWRDGRGWSLYDLLTHEDSRSIGIPVRMSNGAPASRACTVDFKIRVIAQWMKAHGCTPDDKGLIGLGISIDEFKRMRVGSGIAWYDITYPLIDMRLDRSRCHGIITAAGLPVPSPSSCFFCPFHSLNTWREMRDTKPELFQRSVELEQTINRRRAKIGKDEVWLTRKLVPLDEAVGPGVQPGLFADEEDACESGYCMV